jgi:hypothetical protein
VLMKCAIVIVGELLLEEPLGPDFIRLDQSCVERARQLLGHADSKITERVYRRKPELIRTPFGTYQFHRLDPALIGGYGPYRNTGNFDIATPAKALFDALYLSTRRGRRLRHFPELSWPANFSRRELREWIAKIDDSKLRVAVTERWDALRHKTQP